MNIWRKWFSTYIKPPKNSSNDPLYIADMFRHKGMQIGEGTYIYSNVVFGHGGKDPIIIGRNCVLTGCTILAHDACTNRALGIERSITQQVIIEDDCFIGYGAIVLMGVRIGKGSIVGAGTVVTSSVPEGTVVVGNPARILCSVDDLVQKRRKLITEHPEIVPVVDDTVFSK